MNQKRCFCLLVTEGISDFIDFIVVPPRIGGEATCPRIHSRLTTVENQLDNPASFASLASPGTTPSLGTVVVEQVVHVIIVAAQTPEDRGTMI